MRLLMRLVLLGEEERMAQGTENPAILNMQNMA
jgi:hypothetical protein